jgi:hypothetical protein
MPKSAIETAMITIIVLALENGSMKLLTFLAKIVKILSVECPALI